MQHAWGTEIFARFWWGDLKGTGHLQDLGVDGTTLLKWIIQEV